MSPVQSSLPASRRRSPHRRRPPRPQPNRASRPPAANPARRAAIDAFDAASSAFSTLGVPAVIVKMLGVDGITIPTPVQVAVIPDAMAGRDVLGRARTGSGKTLAFGLPILVRLAGRRSRAHHPRALIILPTRELAGQVTTVLEPLAAALGLRVVSVYGGTAYDRQIRALAEGADVVIATPGRLDDLVRRGACRLDDVEIVTLDEADHLCDLGFYPVVSALLSATPSGGQRLLLSATLDGDVDRLVRRHLVGPARHEVDPEAGAMAAMEHHVLVVGVHNKLEVITELVRANPRSIVFTRTKGGATRLAKNLTAAGVNAVDLHGDLSQRVRERNLHRFSAGHAQVVVATDVAARGIHVDGVAMVVHYDPAGEAKSYLHRSGRTARAGASGNVVTVAMPDEARKVAGLHRRAGVQARHLDARSVAGAFTAEALAAAPELRPERLDSATPARRSGRGRASRPAQRYRRRNSPAGHVGFVRGGTGK